MAEAATSVAQELERLAALRDQGALTDDEFTAQKQRILGTPSAPVAPELATPAMSDGIGDLWVYLMLAVPLAAAAIVAVAVNEVPPQTLGKLFVLPNLLLMLMDHGRLKAAGRGLPLWQMVLAVAPLVLGALLNPILGALFGPIYLFLRARRLHRGYDYVALYVVALAAPILAAQGRISRTEGL